MEENNNKILRRSNKMKLLASCGIIRNIFFIIILILIYSKVSPLSKYFNRRNGQWYNVPYKMYILLSYKE